MPDDAVKLSVDLSETNLRFSDDLPPLTSAVAHVDGTGHTVTVLVSSADVDLGDNRVLSLGEGRFAVADTTRKPSLAQVSFHAQGGADAFVAAMEHDALRGPSQQLAPESFSGQGDAHVQFALTLRDGVKPRDIPLTIQGSFTKLTVQDVGAGQKLENAQLGFTIAGGVMSGKGEGRFLGVPATIDVRKEASDPSPQIKLALTLDEAARAKLGLHAGKTLTGPLPIKIAPASDAGPAPAFDIEADLSRAAIDGFLPGWTKPAGRAGKLTFRVAPGDDQTRFSKINLSAAPVVVTGELTTGKDGALLSAKFDSFKLSPGDDLRVEVARDGNVYKTAVKGTAIDLRPFIKNFMSGSQSDTQDADLELKAANAIGFGEERGSGLDLRLSRRGQGLTDFRFSRSDRACRCQRGARSSGPPVDHAPDLRCRRLPALHRPLRAYDLGQHGAALDPERGLPGGRRRHPRLQLAQRGSAWRASSPRRLRPKHRPTARVLLSRPFRPEKRNSTGCRRASCAMRGGLTCGKR